MDSIGKWRAGTSYGPVLSQTDLYLLRCELELNPILLHKHASFHLVFSLVTGQTSGFNQEARDRDIAFTQKDEPATMPRVKQLIIITEHSPWCTVVTNDNGVTMGDICVQLYREYTTVITPPELTSIPARTQEQIKRIAAHNFVTTQGGWQSGYFPTTPIPTEQLKRYDWLRERVYFEGLRRDDKYAVSRLGYSAPNIFVMDLSN